MFFWRNPEPEATLKKVETGITHSLIMTVPFTSRLSLYSRRYPTPKYTCLAANSTRRTLVDYNVFQKDLDLILLPEDSDAILKAVDEDADDMD